MPTKRSPLKTIDAVDEQIQFLTDTIRSLELQRDRLLALKVGDQPVRVVGTYDLRSIVKRRKSCGN
jgi:hypothetical protein